MGYYYHRDKRKAYNTLYNLKINSPDIKRALRTMSLDNRRRLLKKLRKQSKFMSEFDKKRLLYKNIKDAKRLSSLRKLGLAGMIAGSIAGYNLRRSYLRRNKNYI